MAATAIAWAVLWTLSDRWWPATLFLFGPRWILLVPLAALLAAAVLLRASLLVPLLVAAIILLVPVMGLRVGWRSWLGADDTPKGLRVVTLNTGASNTLALEVPVLLKRWRADVIGFQECGPALQAAVRQVAGWHARADDELCLLSRYPIHNASHIKWNELAAPQEAALGGSSEAARYVIETPERPVPLVNLHLETPRKGIETAVQFGVRRISENTTLRAEASRRTREWLTGGEEESLIIMGDFNMPVESTIYQRDWSEFRNAFSDAGTGFGATRDNGWIQARIDHVLTGRAWRAKTAVVDPVTGVDHRPVIAELVRLDTRKSTAPVASATVTPASLALDVGTTQLLIAILKDAKGNAITARPVAWSSSNTAIATVSTRGLVTSVAAGTATITATSEGQSGTATVSVSATPPPGRWSNEPSGLTMLTDYSGNVLPPPGWSLDDDGVKNVSIVSDPTAPFSPSTVYQHLYPARHVAGTGGAVSRFTFSRNEIFIGTYFKFSSPWTQTTANVSKLFYVYQWLGDNRQATAPIIAGPTGGPLTIHWENDPTGERLRANVASTTIVPGRWYRFEIYMKKSSASGAPNGVLRWWIDGVLQGDYPNARLRGEPFSEFHLNPVWGGLGGTKPRDEYLRYDHFYISGR